MLIKEVQKYPIMLNRKIKSAVAFCIEGMLEK
jgi:hypothetical protein